MTRRETTSRRRWRAAAACGLALAAVAALPAGASPTTSAGSSPGGVTVAGSFAPTVDHPGSSGAQYDQDVGLFPDPASHLLFTVDSLSPAFVAAYRLSDLRPASSRGLLLDGVESASLVVPGQPGVVLAVSAAGRGQPTTAIDRVAASRGVPRRTDRIALAPGALGPAQVVVGLATGPARGLLFALSVAYTPNGPIPGTVELSLLRLRAGSDQLIWHQSLPQCHLPLVPLLGPAPGATSQTAPLGYVPGGSRVDLGCTSLGQDNTKPPIPAGVGIVTLSAGATPGYRGFTLEPIPGDTTAYPAGVWVPGLDRLAVQVFDNLKGSGWWVFDGRHDAFVGVVPLGSQNTSGAGVDPVHGRMYLISNLAQTGLVAADAGPTPVDQGHVYSPFYKDERSGPSYGAAPAGHPIAVDPGTGRVFILYAYPASFLVADDTVGYYSAPAAPNVDANTINVPERGGVTGATYSGTAQGYGSIIRQVGGTANLQYNAVPLGQNANQAGDSPQLATSYLTGLHLTSGSDQAGVVAAVPDNSTAQQLGTANTSWPYLPANCVNFGGAPQHASADGGSVSCGIDAVTGSVVGGGSGDALPGQRAPDVAAVSATTLSATGTGTVDRGMSTTVTSVARGISLLGGVLRIGQVAVEAKAWAHGRPGTAGSTFHRTISGVVLDGVTLCTSSCDPALVADRVNAALDGRLQLSFPEPNPVPAAGSPGGYQAAVQRDPYAQTNEVQLNDQPTDRTEVPGLQATIYQDNYEPAHTVVYLAGVEAEAHYGIYLLGCTSCSSVGAPHSAQPTVTTTRTRGVTAGRSPGGTGPAATVPAPTAAAASSSGGGGVLGLLRHGWRLLISGLAAALRTFGVWAVLLAPIYLSARRWLLVRRNEVPHV